jgi:ECF transporter S component (folate family)
MCLALFIVLNYASFYITPTIKFSFKSLPVIFISVVFGPWHGAILGLTGEFFSQLISPYGLGPTTPLWILPWIAQGLIVGFLFKQKDVRTHKIRWIITVAISCIVVSTFNTFAIWVDYKLQGHPKTLFELNVIGRVVNSLASIIINALLIPIFFTPLIKQGKFETEE